MVSKSQIKLSPAEFQQLAGFENFLLIKPTWTFQQLLKRREKFIGFFTGNQWGKNVNIVKQYVLRWMGIHPIEEKNIHPEDKIRIYRFCSETLPTDKDAPEDTKNTIYPVIKKMLPPWMILSDITRVDPVITILDIQGGEPIQVEFASYGQTVQKQAGKQRKSIWIDENCTREFYEEQLPRLLASGGDLIVTMTPALGAITWQYGDFYEKARTVIRTPRVCKRFKDRFGLDYKPIETTKSPEDIVVFMAATDDNPFYDELAETQNKRDKLLVERGEHPVVKKIEDFVPITKSDYIKTYLELSDPESEDVRRFGIFRKVSGTIFRDYNSYVHFQPFKKWFPEGIPEEWLHARGIDYHPHVPWHFGACALSPDDEMFIYRELIMSPDNFITREIISEIANVSGDYNYSLNLIDPLSDENQTNSGTSALQEINRIFYELKRANSGNGGYWTTWDTKAQTGRDEIKKRLKNAAIVGQPFQNKGLPTLWVLDSCPRTDEYMRKWRWKEWQNRTMLETNDEKNEPEQKWSHMNMVWEAILKHPGFHPRRGREFGEYRERHTYNKMMRSRR